MGNLVKETFFNGHSDDFRYNSLNQLVTYKTTTNDTYNYEYDKRGNRLGDIGKKENKKYTYSLENQLVEGTNWKGDKSAYSYNALGIRVNNKQTTHSGNVYDRDYVIDYTTVYGIAPTVQNYILPGDIDTAADGWDDGSTTNGFDIGKMLAALNDGFNTLRKNGSYIFVYDYLKNLLAVNGKTGTAQDVEKAADYELVKPCINDFVNHFLGRTVDNSHIIGIGDNNHKLPAYAGAGVTTSDAEFADVSVASFENSDIMVISPKYFDQKHIYTDRGQRMEQKTDTAPNQSGNGGNIKLLYVHEDIMGNTRYHTKDNGQSYAELEYDVWGNPTSPGMLLNNDNGTFIFAQFTGHIYDTVLDIYFAEARFYDAKGRQWLGSDPMKDGLNWYQYVRSNPATWVDPSGLVVDAKNDTLGFGKETTPTVVIDSIPNNWEYRDADVLKANLENREGLGIELIKDTKKYIKKMKDELTRIKRMVLAHPDQGVYYIQAKNLLYSIMADAYNAYVNGYFSQLACEFINQYTKTINQIVKITRVDETTHYFRNIMEVLSPAPKTLDEMIKRGKDEGWSLLNPDMAQYHMYGHNGQQNLKFVHKNGFEAVYDASGRLLGRNNDPVNMGTYNYSNATLTGGIDHYLLDVEPFYSYGNIGEPNLGAVKTTDKTKYEETKKAFKAA